MAMTPKPSYPRVQRKGKKTKSEKSKDVAMQMWSVWEGENDGRDGIVGKTGDYIPRTT